MREDHMAILRVVAGSLRIVAVVIAKENRFFNFSTLCLDLPAVLEIECVTALAEVVTIDAVECSIMEETEPTND